MRVRPRWSWCATPSPARSSPLPAAERRDPYDSGRAVGDRVGSGAEPGPAGEAAMKAGRSRCCSRSRALRSPSPRCPPPQNHQPSRWSGRPALAPARSMWCRSTPPAWSDSRGSITSRTWATPRIPSPWRGSIAWPSGWRRQATSGSPTLPHGRARMRPVRHRLTHPDHFGERRREEQDHPPRLRLLRGACGASGLEQRIDAVAGSERWIGH